MIKISFICTGNICRSVMAECYMKKKISDLGKSRQIKIFSCGINATLGQEATDYTKKSLQEYNVNIVSHLATNVEDAKLEDMDYIFCMTKSHERKVTNTYPTLKDKVYTLKEYVGETGYIDIDDPWGLSLEVYQSTTKEIVYEVDKLLEIILKEI